MADNELLKRINREIKVTSLENTEKADKLRLKSEKEDKENEELENEDNDNEETSELEENEDDDNDNNEDSEQSEEVDEQIEEIAKEQIDEISDDIKTDVLSSDPSLITSDELPVERNEIDDVSSADGILNDYKQDKSAAFIDPDSQDENDARLKVVDTTLGVFTILNHDENSVLLLDCNKQKIQISVEDFNNLHPFEIRDERLSEVNDFKDAYNRDKKDEEEAQELNDEEQNGEFNDEGSDEYDDIDSESDDEFEEPSFGESFDRTNAVKPQTAVVQKKDRNSNVLTEIQKSLTNKVGVKETIRTDVRSKNRCVLVANKSKVSKDKDIVINETRPKVRQKRHATIKVENKINRLKNIKNEKKKHLNKKEATQPSAIITTPTPIGQCAKNDFDVNKVLTIKDGKFVLVKLEGKTKTAYLKLKPKKSLLSINELKFSLSDVTSFLESLDCVSDNYYILEKEIVMKKFRKYESEEVEAIEDELDINDAEEEEDDVEELDDEDVELEEDDEEVQDEEELDEEEPDSIPFSTEVNGVKYAGTLYRVDDEEADEEDEDSEEESDEDVEDEDDQDVEDEDLILQDEEELDSLDFPEGLDESVIKANARIYGKRYNVSFCNVKKESVRKAKLEMRRHNIVEAWNALVRGARTIKC